MNSQKNSQNEKALSSLTEPLNEVNQTYAEYLQECFETS